MSKPSAGACRAAKEIVNVIDAETTLKPGLPVIERFAGIIDQQSGLLPLIEALVEIAKGKGAFNRDPLTHAENCLEEMKELAVNAIAKAEGREGT